MKRHNLLFRYLDGEITREEDKTLREIIKNDPELGEDLQAFLEIDYQVNKINNEFQYPNDFINYVGNKISNRIVLDNELNHLRKQLKKQYATRFVLIPAIIAIFFFTFLTAVRNPEINLLQVSSRNFDEKLTQLKEEVKQKSNSEFSRKPIATLAKPTYSYSKVTPKVTSTQNYSQPNNEKTLTTNSENLSSSIAKSTTSDNNSSSNYDQMPITHDQMPHSVEINNQKNINHTQYHLNIPSQRIFQNDDFTVNPKYQSLNSNIFQSALISNSNIEMSTLLGSDIMQIGVDGNQQIINSITQSFATEISNGSTFGLETGFMEFRANTKKITEITKKSNLGGITILELENNSSENPILIRIEGVELIVQKMFWVGLFYERNFLEVESLNISSRISLGASDYGMISSLKFIAKYKLTKNINITIGTDAKVFEGSFNENQINKLNSTFSLIYGVKFSF